MKFILIGLCLLLASNVFAANGDPGTFNQGQIVQGFAPNGLSSTVLTVASVTYDMKAYAAFSVYAPADGFIRFMTSTSKVGSIQEPVEVGHWNTFVVNKATPFVNFSGMTSGFLRRQ